MIRHILAYFILGVIVFGLGDSNSHAVMLGDKLDIGGYIQNESAISTHEDRDALWCENKVLVYGTYNISHQIRAFFRVQGYYDAINDIQSTDYRNVSDERYINRQTYFRENLWQPKSYTTSEYLKELFIEYENDSFDIRVGKQQFAWGVTDGLKVLDIVYPQDFRKFNQEDFEESRIPLWSIKFDYYVGEDSEIQLVYIPNFEASFFPGGGHPFATWDNEIFDVLDIYGAGGATFDVKYNEPSGTFDNGEYGAMWRNNLGDWSYSLNFMSHFTDVSGAYATGITTMSTHVGPPAPAGADILVPINIELTRKNNRMYSVGSSFDTTLSHIPVLGTVIFRAEAIYNFDNIMMNIPDKRDPTPFREGNYLVNPIFRQNGDILWEAEVPFPETVEIDDWTYALGIDKYVFTDYFLSFQFVQHHIRDYKSSFVNPITGRQAEGNDYWCTFLIQKDWLNEKLWTKVLNVVGRHGDYWIQPQLSYLFKEKYKVTIQGNFYGGASNNMWSRFDESDNIAFRVAYQF